MTTRHQVIRRLLCVIFFDQTYLTLTFPLLTLIFFDSQSRLFPPATPYAERSIYYGLCIALPNFINLFFAPFLSALSDEIGRKKILLIEIISAGVFTLMVGLGIYYGILALVFFGFVIKGAFSRANPTALAIIGDAAPKNQKILYMGYLQFAISMGAAIGPFLGGYLASRYFFPTLNFSFPFFLGTLFALGNTLFVTLMMPETHQRGSDAIGSEFNFRAFREVISHPDVIRISLLLILIQLSWSTYYQFIPPILKIRYGFSPQQLGEFIAMIAVGLAITTGLGIKFLHRFLSPYQMLLLALCLITFGLLFTLCICLLNISEIYIWAGALPVAAGDVIAYTCLTAFYSNLMPLKKQGKVMGISFIVVGACWATTGLLGGYLLSYHPLLPLMVAPLGVLIALSLMLSHFGEKLVLSY